MYRAATQESDKVVLWVHASGDPGTDDVYVQPLRHSAVPLVAASKSQRTLLFAVPVQEAAVDATAQVKSQPDGQVTEGNSAVPGM